MLDVFTRREVGLSPKQPEITMSITLQARQADGTWAVRNAFTTENAKVRSGSMSVSDLEVLARRTMSKWQATMQDGRQLRVHSSANDPAPAPRKRPDSAVPHAEDYFDHVAALRRQGLGQDGTPLDPDKSLTTNQMLAMFAQALA
jgi:hypothetical protein